MEIIDNKQGRLLGDEIKKRISPDTSLFLSTGYFSIYSFFFLKDKLKEIKEIEILLLTYPMQNSPIGVSLLRRSDLLFGDNSEQELQNQLLLRNAAEECAEWLNKKAKISTLIIPNSFGMKMLVLENNDANNIAINTNLSDFTATTLGYVASDNIHCNILQTELPAVDQLKNLFSQVWNNPLMSKDIKQYMLSSLKLGYRDYPPDFIYYYTLNHIFNDSIKDFDDDKLIKTRTGFKDKRIWQKLYKFQKDGVVGAIEKIERYGGCIIADSVGLGKTFEALAIIKYYELRNDRVLVLCPKKLRENWSVYTQNDRRNIFLEDRFNYDVLHHSDLTRERGLSGTINLKTINWANYDLVVIDESHNFRNNNPHKGEKTRYARLMNEIIRKGVKTKLLMLSATPVNNRMNDLKNQISFITEGDDSAFVTEGIDNITSVMALAQRQFTEWTKSDIKDINTLFERLDSRYFKLLDMLTIARSRKHIVKYYNCDDVGKFPERLKPINIKTDIDSRKLFPSLKDINTSIRKLNLANFTPMEYVLAEKRADYEEKYDYELKTGSVFKQIDREKSLIHLMRVNYLKRMESSINSFSISIKGLLKQVNDNLEKITNSALYIGKAVTIEDVDLEDTDNEALVGNKVKVLLQDMDLVRWKQDLEYDRDILAKLLESARNIDSIRDEKLEELKRIIANKIDNPINRANRKVVIFTAFADTANYLYHDISTWAHKKHGIYSTLITGTGANKTNLPHSGADMNDLLTSFSPISKERSKTGCKIKEEIDILIATDCISEGQNLQDCDFLVNYDIHWNPVRIIQRFGRIDRLGSINERVQLVNFWPNMELNEYINLESRVKGKMVLLDISATGEENLIEMNGQDEMNDLEYRRKQLEQLQNTVLDLEDIQGGMTITDSNMNDFRMDLLEYSKSNKDNIEQTPHGVHTVVYSNDPEIVEGTIFCLRNRKGEKGKSILSPYYLVYVGKEGETLLGYMQGKRCLDYMKKLCQGQIEVVKELAAQVNKETRNYRDMKKYSVFLQVAMESIIGKSHEIGAASFFSTDGVALAAEGVTAKSDFEVISFVVIKSRK
ncbi:MAG: helicase [Bacteroidetes bacterium HGW-Bacteroidetes-8]|jgi:SNF2 family DNA or RNA helicase|nr:MAG: helicase [Bacteroidetes bacterium HGW-Bacteroidetes-8]